MKVEASSSCRGISGKAEDGRTVLLKRGTSQRFRRDVGEVVSGGVFDEEDIFALLGVVDHGVLWSDSFLFGRDALAAGAVDEDAGVGVDGGRPSGCMMAFVHRTDWHSSEAPEEP